MGLQLWLRQVEGRYPWGMIGAILGTAIGLYGWFHERKPAVAFDVVSEANVLDVHTALPELTVLFRGEDIQKKDLNLRVLRVRTGNIGEADITQGLYDESEPWGLVVSGGRVVEVRLADASSPYLMRSVIPHLVDDSTIQFAKVILEKDAAFVVELLVLHPRTHAPHITPFGKIAGVQQMHAFQRDITAQPSFWQSLLVGSLWVHVVRFIGYVLVLIVLSVVFAFLFSRIADARKRRKRSKRRKHLESLLEKTPVTRSRTKDVVVDLYVYGGEPALLAAARLAAASAKNLFWRGKRIERVQTHVDGDWRNRLESFISSPIYSGPIGDYADLPVARFVRRSNLRDIVQAALATEGLLSTMGEETRVSQEFAQALQTAIGSLGLRLPAARASTR